MNGKGWILPLMTMTLLFFSSGMVMVSKSSSSVDDARPKMVIVLDHGVPVQVRVEDMAEGESRSISMDGKEVLVSRQGQGLTAEVDGRELLSHHVVLPGDSRRMNVFIHKGDAAGTADIEIQTDKTTVLSGDGHSIQWVSGDGEKEIILADEACLLEFDLADLADGESRNLEAGSHELVVTRDGDVLRLKMDGEDLPEVPFSVDREGHVRLILLESGSGKEDPESGQARWIAKASDGKTESRTVMVVKEEGSSSRSGTFVWHAAEDGKKHKTYAVKTRGAEDAEVEHITIAEGLSGNERKVDLTYHSDDERLIIAIDGESAEISTAELASGETRTVTLGEHTLLITREDNAFRFMLDGEEISNMVFHVTSQDEDDEHVVVRRKDVHRLVEKSFDVSILETEEDGEGSKVIIKTLGPGRDVLICSAQGVMSLAVESFDDGESRELTLGENIVAVTREGDRLRLDINGTVLYY
jgi:hypothetical protein